MGEPNRFSIVWNLINAANSWKCYEISHYSTTIPPLLSGFGSTIHSKDKNRFSCKEMVELNTAMDGLDAMG